MSDLSWHQTRGVTVTIITLLLANIISSVWWAATITSDVDKLKNKPNLVERVIRLEAVQDQNTRYLSRLSIVLDRLESTVRKIDKEQVRRSELLDRTAKHLIRERYEPAKTR